MPLPLCPRDARSAASLPPREGTRPTAWAEALAPPEGLTDPHTHGRFWVYCALSGLGSVLGWPTRGVAPGWLVSRRWRSRVKAGIAGQRGAMGAHLDIEYFAGTIQLDRSCLLDLLSQELRPSLVTGLELARAWLTLRRAEASAAQSLPSQLHRSGFGMNGPRTTDDTDHADSSTSCALGAFEVDPIFRTTC